MMGGFEGIPDPELALTIRSEGAREVLLDMTIGRIGRQLQREEPVLPYDQKVLDALTDQAQAPYELPIGGLGGCEAWVSELRQYATQTDMAIDHDIAGVGLGAIEYDLAEERRMRGETASRLASLLETQRVEIIDRLTCRELGIVPLNETPDTSPPYSF